MSQKVAVITGISSGMGKAAAELFNQNGWVVYGGARRGERLTKLSEKGIHTMALDVTDENSNANLVKTVMNEAGRIDVLINNAGYGEYGPLEEVSMAKAKQQMDVNLFGAANLIQLVLPIMRQQGSGRIINNSSIGGRLYAPMGGWYHASKHALEVYSDVLRNEVKSFGIQVSVIEPGATKTEWSEIAAKTGKETTEKQSNSAYQHIEKAFSMADVSGMPVPVASSEDIAKLMWRAATDRKTKRRYLPGFGERVATFMFRKLPVSWTDAMLQTILKRRG